MSPLFNLNLSWIWGANNKVNQASPDIEEITKLLSPLYSELSEHQNGLPYPIDAIELNDSNIQPEDGLVNRDTLIAKLCDSLEEHKCLILNGDILIGKTILAELIGLAKPDYNPLIFRLSYDNSINPSAHISFIAKQDRCKLLIIDGFPEYRIETTEHTCQIIQNAIGKGIKVLLTARSFNTLIANKYRFLQYTVPAISDKELQKSFPQCTEELSKLIISISEGYPMLVNLLLLYLEVNNWNLSKPQLVDFISIPNKTGVQEYANRKVREIITDTQDLQLLSRLSLYWRPFSVDDAVFVADAKPIIVTPKDRLNRLQSQRLVIPVNGKLKISPFIKKIWTTDLLSAELKECCNIIVKRVMHKHSIDVLDANNIIMLLCNAKEYERAGYFYITVMTKLLESKCNEASQVSFLTMLWRDLPLPSEMTIFTRTFIRILQIQLAHFINEDCSYETNDLIYFIDELPLDNPLKAVASCFAIADLSSSGNFQKALPLLQYTQPAFPNDLNENYLAIVEAQKGISNKLPVLMLVGIKNLDNLMKWLDEIEKTGITTESIDADAVKYALNHVIILGQEEIALNAIIAKTRRSESLKVFTITAVARLMLYFSDKKRYSEAWCLYNENKTLAETKLGNILINNALACYYYDIEEHKDAIKCWATVCSNGALSLCPDEVMFASTATANIYSQKGGHPDSVCCLQNVINDPSFDTALTEYQQMQMRGELAVAYWENNQRKESLEQLLLIHDYLYNHRLDTDDDYKLLQIKFGICVQQYHLVLEKGAFNENFAIPMLTMFYYPNRQFLEAYNKARTGTNTMYLFMIAAALNLPKKDALVLAHYTIECFADLIKEKNIACGLLNELVPILLEFNEYDNAEYLVKSSLGLASQITDASSPVRLVCYLPLLSLCLKKLVDSNLGIEERIDSMISTHLSASIDSFPTETNLLSLREVLVNHNDSEFSNIKDEIAKISAKICRFEQLDLKLSINVTITASMFFHTHKYYGYGLLRLYVYYHSMFIIKKYATNYHSLYKNPIEELERVFNSELRDIEAAKKMIKLLVAYSKEEIPLTKEHEDFIGL